MKVFGNISGRTLSGLATAVVMLVSFSGCQQSESTTVRSIDEIHREDGVPVETRTVQPEDFRTYMTFTTNVSGASESTASAMVSDAVADVLFQVGDYVEKDTPIVLFPVDNPALKWEQTRLGLNAAKTSFERVQTLYNNDGVSRQTFDNAHTQYQVAQANWETVQDMAQVKAPISGYITRINVSASDNVRQGSPLFTVSDLSQLKAVVWLTDRQVADVKAGQKTTAVWQNQEVSGTVVQVDLAMDQTRKAFGAHLLFENPDLHFRSGVTSTVHIETYRNEAAVILNQREIVESAAGASAFVVQNGRAVRVPIGTGRRQDLLTEVIYGLELGDEVVVKGIELIENDTTVRVVDQADRLVQR